ncbi:hypothetical protein G7054_g7538 [Neopestalotiopsis clavispora]|nr:hypothetical protein G7054_g7538 [Neopestalotiopsis clavispora]
MTLYTVALSLLAAAGTLAAPTAGAAEVLPPHVERRGPHNFFLGPDHPLMLARRNVSVLEGRSTNYVQDYTTGGTVDLTPSSGGFSLSFDTTEDFVVGVGWNPGSTSPITYSGSFSVSSGLGTLSVYGWTENPLVEYYVIEDSSGYSQTGTQKGTVSSDGGTYVIWENQRVNEPSIVGTSTFNQYISVRESGRTSGTVTIENHFNAWKNVGLDLGTMNFQVIAVESWNGAGSAQQTISN